MRLTSTSRTPEFMVNGPRNLSRICFLFDDSAAIIEVWPIARVRRRAATYVATLFHRDVKECAVTYAAHHGLVAGTGEIRRDGVSSKIAR